MKTLLPALALISWLAPPVAADSKSAEWTGFSGTWVLNKAMSESADEKLRELRAQRRSGRGPGLGGPPDGTGRGGGVPGQRPGGFGDPRSGRDQPRSPWPSPDQGVDRLEIRRSDDQFSITYSDDRLRILFVDGRKDKRTSPAGDVETTARWNKDGELFVKAKSRRRKTTEVYKLDSAGRLLVDLTLDLPIGKITVARTYDRAQVDPDKDEDSEGG